MAFIPHPPVFLSQIRVNDIWFLLAVGAVWEIGCRLFVLSVRMKPGWLVRKEDALRVLQAETDEKRKLGPQAFVETSKLERQVLAQEMDLQKIYEGRKTQGDRVEKQLLRYGNMQVAAVIFFLYYGVAIFTVEATDAIGEYEAAGSFMKKLLFPISYVGMGGKISKFGMAEEIAQASIGALMVLWSAQVTAGKLMDALDAFYL